MIVDRGAVGGDCEPVSDAIVEELRGREYNAWTCLTDWRGHPHTVAAVGRFRVDATRDQFYEFGDSPAEEEEIEDNPIVVWKV